MALLLVVCTLAAILNAAHSQSLNRLLPNGIIADTYLPSIGNQLNYLPYDLPFEILPNIYPGGIQPNGFPLPNMLQQLPNVLQPLPSAMQTLPNVLQPGVVTPTIIQENPVATNLANALQLLVVSNLLRNTLPQARDVVAPGIPGYPPIEYLSAPCGMNYLY